MESMLVELATALHRRIAFRARAQGVRWSAVAVLADLQARGARAQGELARRQAVRPATMSLLVRELKAGGLVEESPDPGDARRRLVGITGAGRRRLAGDRARLAEPLSAAVAALDPETRAALAAALPGLLRALED